MVLDLSSQAYKFPLNLALAECEACQNDSIMFKLVERDLNNVWKRMVIHVVCFIIQIEVVWKRKKEIPTMAETNDCKGKNFL